MRSPSLLGIKSGMLLYLYWRRLRAHPLAELLAGGGVAIGVALAFGVLVSNASLTSSAQRLVRGLAGSAQWALVARSPQGFDARWAQQAGELPGVQVASPILRENVTLIGPGGQRAVQLIGVTPSLESLGGLATQELAAGSVLLKGGVGLPAGVQQALGTKPGQALEVASDGRLRRTRMRAALGDSLPSIVASPVAVAVLGVAQMLSNHAGQVSELLVRPLPGRQANVHAELRRFAAGHRLDLRDADEELRLLSVATKPNRQSTSLFTAIAVMIGFLLALNAMLLTVPERRRFIADLRTQGYGPGQIGLLLGLQAMVLGLLSSLLGIAVGDALARVFFQQTPDFLSAAFPVGAEESVQVSAVLVALGCGITAALLVSLAPLLDLRSGRATDGPFRRSGGGEGVRGRTIVALGLLAAALSGAAGAAALLAPRLTIAGGVGLALASVCATPGVFWALARGLPRLCERMRSGAMIVVLSEIRTTSTRSVALAGIVGLAVYGGVAIGGARSDLLRGIGQATDQYFGTAQVWVTAGRDVFNTNDFSPDGPSRRLAQVPAVASARVYQGGLLDVGERRMWIRARPLGDGASLEPSQLLHGDLASATRLIDQGGWAGVSSDFAEERRLRLGSRFSLPAPLGTARLRVAAITTNSGWPAGTLTLGGGEYRHLWGAGRAAALEVDFRRGMSAAAGRRLVQAALVSYPGLQVRTAHERAIQSKESARQGLRTLAEISTLLLVTAALAVASALAAAIWQRRSRLAGLKIQGYHTGQLWRAVLIESTLTLGVGSLVGASMGVGGHALASRFLQVSTGFPAPFSAGPMQALLTISLFAAIAVAVIALPGLLAARVSARVVLDS